MMPPKVKKKVLVKTYTREQLQKMLLAPCKGEQDLKNFIKYFLELELPDQKVSRFADTDPFHMVWEMYDICVNKHNPQDIQELLYVAARGSGKCVTKDTSILTRNGCRSIQDIRAGDEVFTGWNWKPVVETFDEGIKPSVTLKTRHLSKMGAWSLTGSHKHRIQALNEGSGKIDWVRMVDLKPDQIIYRSCESPYTINTKVPEYWDGWLIGVLVGDGAVNRHQSNEIVLCGSDFPMLRRYAELIHEKFGIKQTVRRNSKKSVNLRASNRQFKDWFSSFIDGELSYFKKLKTLSHAPDFLAGFIAGLMDTDGSKDSITLANPQLIQQVAQIFTVFGVHTAINTARRKPSTTKFVPDLIVEYHAVEYKTPLPDYLMPQFSKVGAFRQRANKLNQQFRYPSKLLKSFAAYIKDKYEIGGGYWKLGCGKKTHSNIKYANDLWGAGSNSKELYVYGHKIDYFIELANRLNEQNWAEYLTFVRRGYYETVDSIEFSEHYFYDLEVECDHSYWSNGFISHNTLGAAIAELLIILHDQRDTAHVGAILSQAKRCYNYQQKFILSHKLRPLLQPSDIPEDQRILEKSNMEKSVFNIGGEKIALEVLPATLKAVNGFHGPLVVVDEVDTISGEGIRAYQDITGMLDSKGDKKALRVGISTRKSRYGLMNRAMENADKEGRTVRKWTVLEFSRRCADDRSGVVPTIGFYNQDKMETITAEDYAKKDKTAQNEYLPHKFYGEKCLECPIAALCLSDAKNQCSKSPMLKPIEDAIKKARENGPDWCISQLFNLKPSVEGIIYKEYEEKLHAKTWNEMWKILTSTEFPGECSHDMFVKKCRQMKLSCYAGIDWGWSNPSTLVVFFVDPKENVYVVKCDGRTYYNNPNWIHLIKSKYHAAYGIQLYFPDLANPGDGQLMRDAGLMCPAKVDKNVPDGIQIVKKWLRSLASPVPKIFFAKETCQPILQEFTLFHFETDAAGVITDTPCKEHDHWLDALRYPMFGLFGKPSMITAGYGIELDSNPAMDNNGQFMRTPNAAEYSQSQGITLDTSTEPKKLGEIGTLSQLMSEDDDDINGSGGFLWSFS